MNAKVERWYPETAGVAVGILFLWFFQRRGWTFPGSIKEMFQAVINVGAIAVGFLGTAYSILLALEDSRPVVHYLKEAGVYTLLVGYLMSAIKYCFVATMVAVLWLIFDDFRATGWYLYGFAAWLFFAVAAILSCHRAIIIFARILATRS